jgi:hypothetical protein
MYHRHRLDMLLHLDVCGFLWSHDLLRHHSWYSSHCQIVDLIIRCNEWSILDHGNACDSRGSWSSRLSVCIIAIMASGNGHTDYMSAPLPIFIENTHADR